MIKYIVINNVDDAGHPYRLETREPSSSGNEGALSIFI